ncbi:flavodoxin family protein [Fusibacter ferrireducens]|uniref:Flavodoxin family protein n=1 Tax=Fusibacter ferrireducens TaxID=2785058 RepID=A0ABR9ZUP0_9FIRM|nr:flavodoxin family protein [Fusibacter ferrireducens]MBF4694180.1 flavodoxin family protein [Fusibacter ferrireducens]
MKVIAINGSPRKEGNTYHALKIVGDELEKEGIEVEIVHVGNQMIRGCMGCNTCMKNRNEKCVIDDDLVNEAIQKMKEADGILLGSPVHYAAVGGTMKSFLDRAFYAGSGLYRHKVGAAVVAVRRSGGLPTFTQLNNFINYAEMVMPTSNYWNVIHGGAPGEVMQDEEGKQIMRVLGKNMAWLMKTIEHGKQAIPAPEKEKKTYMSFIRK